MIRNTLRSAALALTVAALGGAQAQAPAPAPIKIGFMAELSGPQGALGQDQYDAFMLVVERNGGRLGGVPVQILREDSQLRPDVATQIVQRLIERENVPIITGVTFSNVMMAVHKPITERGVFLIGSNAGPAPIAGAQCSPYQFITSWQNDNQAEVVGAYANDKGYRRIVAMAPNYQAGKDFVAGFKRTYKGEVIDEVYTPLNQPDFAAELAQVAAKRPDAIYVFYPGGLGVNFVRQYQQAGLLGRIPLLSSSTTDGSTLPALREAALGVISGTFWGPDFGNPANKRFVEEFERKHNRIPSQYAAQSYDAALLLDSAIAKVNGNIANKDAFRAALKAADFQSVRGNFRFGNNHFPIQDHHIFEVARDGQGRVSLKTIATPLRDHVDAYASQCRM
jgi:branched-chain amino acid transport system substrate-binding protein